jgi:hypothetical protein
MLRTDDFSKMKEMVTRLRKHRQNEAKSAGPEPGMSGNLNGNGGAGGNKSGGNGTKAIPARTSI